MNRFSIVMIGLLIILLVSVCGSLVSAIGKTTPTNVSLTLPSDFDKVISINNNRNGVVVAYYTEDGHIKAIQYSGADYNDTYTFEFVKGK